MPRHIEHVETAEPVTALALRPPLAVVEEASFSTLSARTIAACSLATRFRDATRRVTERYLRQAREAGRMLLLLPRSRGGRPHNNSSIQWTSFQRAVAEAGICRATASKWQQLAAIPDAEFEQRVAEMVGRCTMDTFLRGRTTRGRRRPIENRSALHSITICCAHAEWAAVTDYLNILAERLGCSPSNALLHLVLEARARDGRRGGADGDSR